MLCTARELLASIVELGSFGGRPHGPPAKVGRVIDGVWGSRLVWRGVFVDVGGGWVYGGGVTMVVSLSVFWER